MISIILSSNPDLLEARLRGYVKDGCDSITIEAEYGDRLVEGSILTLSHHGLRKNNPCPCLFRNNGKIEVSSIRNDKTIVFGLSHIDLDTMLALLSILGYLDESIRDSSESFFQLAAFLDINGAHKINLFNASDLDIKKYYACEYYIKKLKPQASSKDVINVTNELVGLALILRDIICEDPDLIKDGEAFMRREECLNKESFIDKIGDLIIRVHHEFVNHLYMTPIGEVGRAIITFNTINGSIIVSFSDPIHGISCKEIVQNLWGKDAGGNDGIAESPRGERMSFSDLKEAVSFVNQELLFKNQEREVISPIG